MSGKVNVAAVIAKHQHEEDPNLTRKAKKAIMARMKKEKKR